MSEEDMVKARDKFEVYLNKRVVDIHYGKTGTGGIIKDYGTYLKNNRPEYFDKCLKLWDGK